MRSKEDAWPYPGRLMKLDGNVWTDHDSMNVDADALTWNYQPTIMSARVQLSGHGFDVMPVQYQYRRSWDYSIILWSTQCATVKSPEHDHQRIST